MPPSLVVLLGELAEPIAAAVLAWWRGRHPERAELTQEPARGVGVLDLVVVVFADGKRTVGRVVAIESADLADVELLDGGQLLRRLRRDDTPGWRELG